MYKQRESVRVAREWPIYRLPDATVGRRLVAAPIPSSYIGGLSSYGAGLGDLRSRGPRGLGLSIAVYTLPELGVMGSPGYGNKTAELALEWGSCTAGTVLSP